MKPTADQQTIEALRAYCGRFTPSPSTKLPRVWTLRKPSDRPCGQLRDWPAGHSRQRMDP